MAFPTETVYGLGANALDESAVLSIFTTKGRPLTDPLIVHVPTKQEALALLEMSPTTKDIYELLATTFWPGPLTMVGKAIPAIPLMVTAGTGFVGIRCPQHELARRLLIEARVPVAAPSANRFGHVSPTTAQHVYEDLGGHSIAIIDGESQQPGDNGSTEATCNVGIESTVAKVDGVSKKIIIFRRGGVSESAIREALSATDYTVEALSKKVPHDLSTVPTGAADIQEIGSSTKVDLPHSATGNGEQAPGQCLTHYAPDVPTSLVRCGGGVGGSGNGSGGGGSGSGGSGSGSGSGLETTTDGVSCEVCTTPLSACVVVDFGGHLQSLRAGALDYRDLSTTGNVSEAAHELFDALRWTERVKNGE